MFPSRGRKARYINILFTFLNTFALFTLVMRKNNTKYTLALYFFSVTGVPVLTPLIRYCLRWRYTCSEIPGRPLGALIFLKGLETVLGVGRAPKEKLSKNELWLSWGWGEPQRINCPRTAIVYTIAGNNVYKSCIVEDEDEGRNFKCHQEEHESILECPV